MVILMKYGEEWRKWSLKMIQSACGCSLWRGIRAGWDRVMKYMKFDVGNAKRVKFWHDQLCTNYYLKGIFLNCT